MLLIGAEGDRTHRGLVQLGYDPVVVAPTAGALRQTNFFSQGLIITSIDVNRDVLNTPDIRTTLLHAIEQGNVFLGFRDWKGTDDWLPVPVEKDAAFAVDTILAPTHPVLQTPHPLTVSDLRRVHSGSMYGAFIHAGEGWQPIVGGQGVFPWYLDQRGQPEYPNEMHYGLMELPYGKGRIILCQFIPEYDWYEDHKGRDTAVGKLLFENLVEYAMKKVSIKRPFADPPSTPDSYVPGLNAVVDVSRRPASAQMQLDLWDVKTDGLFTVTWDDRDVLTVRHPDQPSQQGGYAHLSRQFDLDATPPDGRVLLSFYCTDDYLGGPEPQYEGDRSVGQVQNIKEGYRFVEVRIDGTLVWERDVLGPNAYEWPQLFEIIDITEQARDKTSVDVTISVVDRRSSPEVFWTDVFVSRVQVLQGIVGLAGPGAVTAPHTGDFTPVILVHDTPWERNALLVTKDEDPTPLMNVRLTADDLATHWVVGEPVSLTCGDRIRVELVSVSDDEPDEHVQAVYLFPRAYMAESQPPETFPDVRGWFAAAAAPQRIHMEVMGPTGADIQAPVSHGIPFGQGHLSPSQIDCLQLHDSDEQLVPLQTRPLAYWPDGSIKWLLLNFVGRPGPYSLTVLSDTTNVAQRPLIERQGERSFTVNTGRLAMALDLGTTIRADAVRVDGRDLGSSTFDLIITYANGQKLSLAQALIDEVVLIENGSERAVLWIRGHFLQNGRRDLDFAWQWYFHRDRPVAFVDVAFTNRLGQKVELADVRVKVTGDYGTTVGLPAGAGLAIATQDVAVDTRELDFFKLEDTLSLVQTDERSYTVYRPETDPQQGLRFPGWLTLGADAPDSLRFVAAVRHFWQQAPKSLTVNEDGLEFGLWAGESDQLLEVADGFQKTHRLLFGWTTADEAPIWQALLSQPYLLAVDPHYLVGTQALGVLSVPNPELADVFPMGANYERSVASTYDNYLTKREQRREYGMQNFGDDTFEWGHGPYYTFWSNQEYDHHYGFLLQYLRGQEPRYWQLGDQAALHYRDVDVIHHSTNPLHMGAPRAHNTKHVVDEGWYPDHNMGGVSTTHAWVGGLWLHYLLTGDELTHEAARAASDWFVAEVERGRWGAGGPERGPGWTLIALAGAYRATSDERYLQAAQKVAEEIYAHQDPVRGLYSVPISEQRSYEGGTSFMTGIMGRGLAYLYLETGDPRAVLATARLYDWLTREARYPDNRFLYKQAPNWRQASSDSQIVSLLGFGLAFRDQKEDRSMVERAANLSASVRSLAWMPQTLAVFERLHGTYIPLCLTQPDARAVIVKREGVAQTTLALGRLLASDAASGVLHMGELPAGITVSPQRVEYRLEQGQQQMTFPLSVEIERTVEPGLYELDIRDPHREGVAFTLPISVPSWVLTDAFRAPAVDSWFGIELYSRPTVEESSGWEHVRVGSLDRLQRTSAEEEYLLYDTPGLYDFTLTIYVADNQKAEAESLIEISTKDGEKSEKVAAKIAWEKADNDMAKAIITPREKYARDDVQLKVTFLAGELETLQLGRMEIRGWQ